jgi:hypothetical protein
MRVRRRRASRRHIDALRGFWDDLERTGRAAAYRDVARRCVAPETCCSRDDVAGSDSGRAGPGNLTRLP